MDTTQYPQDFSSFDTVTNALMDTINAYPGLEYDAEFTFSTIPESDGYSVIASNGSYIIEETEDITGHVWQVCQYPFMVVCRVAGLSSRRKIAIKEWMDTLAEWLTRKSVIIDGETYQLAKWPELSGERKIRSISRQTAAYLGGINDDKSENWVMDLVIQYWNEFDR